MSLTKYPHIFTPVQVGNMTLKNRIQFSPIVTNHADFETGRVNRELLEFVGNQAKTGVGLVTIGSTPVNFKNGRDFYGCLSVTNDLDIAGLSLLTDEVHNADCKLSAELVHAGQWAALNNMQAWVPSVIPEYHKELNPDMNMFKEITRAEMLTVIDDYVASVRRCKEAGFDMVMAHFAHGNLLSAFLSTNWNRRGDAYGGSAEKRWKFPLEVLEAMYSVTKGEIPIEMRVVGDERFPGGTPIEERIAFLKEASRYIDMLCVSTGMIKYSENCAECYNMPSYYMPRGLNVEHAAAFKEALGDKLVVSVVGGINDINLAEEIIASGKADMVAMAKALLADDRMIVKAERGKEEDIAPCMRCMYCLRNLGGAHNRGCAVNPRMGWEYRYPRVVPVAKKKKVMIIGGGPGGMQAARTLTERGHDVVLYEKSNELGGRLAEASSMWVKEGFRRYKDYAVRKTMECGAQIHLGTMATAETVKAEAPDALIIAAGAEELRPPIKGIDGSNVVSVVDVDRGTVATGQKVVICGAGMSGAECGMCLGKEGKEVTIVDMAAENSLYKNLKGFTLPIFKKYLSDYNVKALYETKVKEITDKGVLIETADGEEKLLEADTVIIALGLRPNRQMIDELNSIVPETYIIGDSKKIGIIGDATNSAWRASIEI